jgi:predicted flap endonuclease-1-like 5' DNA nuclease
MTKLDTIEGIGPAYAEKLAKAGIRSVEALLDEGATRRGRQALAESTGISEKDVLSWVNYADLFRIKGVAGEYAELLEAAGVDTLPELAQRNPANLYQKMAEVNEAKKLVRQLPSDRGVSDWVAQAKKLPRVIEY